MKIPLQQVALAGVLATLSACKNEPGGLQGELNAGTFYYRCHAASDAQCDEDAVVAAADATTAAFPPIAVGGDFALRFQDDGNRAQEFLITPGSRDFVTGEGTRFSAERSGVVALVVTNAFQKPDAIDLVHVRLSDAVGLRISQATTTETTTEDLEAGKIEVDGSDVEINIDNPVSLTERTFLRAVPVTADDEILAGALTTSWESSDPTIVEIISDATDNVVEIESKGVGTATLTVTMGGMTADITIDAGAGS